MSKQPRSLDYHPDGTPGSLDNPIFHDHALLRWRERFGEKHGMSPHDMVANFRKSRRLCKIGDTIARLAPCNAVFLVSPTWVIVTVLTTEQYRVENERRKENLHRDRTGKSKTRTSKEYKRRLRNRRWTD